MTTIIEVTDQSFDADVIQSEVPVLVDFWAEWCAPCRMLAPVLERLAEDNVGKLIIAKMDVDSNQQIPAKLGVMSIPTLVLYKDGEPATRLVGFMPKEQLQSQINEYL